MIWAVVLAASAPLFFFSVYSASRSGGWKEPAWSALAVLALLGVGASIVQLVIPDFFRG